MISFAEIVRRAEALVLAVKIEDFRAQSLERYRLKRMPDGTLWVAPWVFGEWRAITGPTGCACELGDTSGRHLFDCWNGYPETTADDEAPF